MEHNIEKISIERFDSLELHDIPPKSLALDFASGIIKLVVQRYDETTSSYCDVIFLFTNVQNISIDKIPDIFINEITSHSILRVENSEEKSKVLLKFLYDTTSQIVEVSFSFEEVFTNWN